MALELWWGSGSPYSWRALLALEYKKLPYVSHLVQFAKQEHKSPQMLQMNPRGRVPVLKDGDYVCYESLAILQYLDRKYPDRPLLGTTPEEAGAIMRVISGLALPIFRLPPASSASLRPRISAPSPWGSTSSASWMFRTRVALVEQHVDGSRRPSVIVGSGLDPVTRQPDGDARLAERGIRTPFALYLGRIDNKVEDITHPRYAATEPELRNAIDAVLAGKAPKEAKTRAVGCAINLESK